MRAANVSTCSACATSGSTARWVLQLICRCSRLAYCWMAMITDPALAWDAIKRVKPPAKTQRQRLLARTVTIRRAFVASGFHSLTSG